MSPRGFKCDIRFLLLFIETGEEEDWKKKTGDRVGWRRIADEAV